MTELIAILALCTSVLLLIIHYRDQVERRHGELAKLRSDLMQRLSSFHRNMMSFQMHIETARLELRRMHECDDKYQSIERVPRTIEKVQNLIRRVKKVLSYLDGLDTAKENKGKVLMKLQSAEHDVRDLEDLSSELEKYVLDFLIFIRSMQEKAGEQRAEKLGKAQSGKGEFLSPPPHTT